ncbi:MAG: apolipoprotein N-acyltransferase [Chlorobium sp.]|nr:apolipoprotein N-acyltransferase [Chlorobium sp.]MCF8215639.1 apolipoprotein N-acyltransferase [Chlorobium sp.]MCF8270694.1 apolipoprotein N-acyltransferase [Chlorobium sp.]MCF8286848.1 apolipoprotein N-acyltransferase [Chlorobium sp.]MCF8290576.1 apolipoprotein N-acyltransferase [Chlorobium sp.]MCF8384532.1 apolipoprotein N-acyltransferase [Chlorobium sp.]
MSVKSGKLYATALVPFSLPVLSGLLLGVSFPSYPFIRLELLAWVGLVPLLLSLKQDDSFGSAYRKIWLSMFVFSVLSLWWVSLATLPGGILTVIAESFFLTVPFLPFYLAMRSAGFRYALLSLPFFWTAWEWAYMGQDLSLGWLTFGNSQANLAGMIQYADITGVWGVSFWLVLFNVLVVIYWMEKDVAAVRRRVLAAAVVLIALPYFYGRLVFGERVSPGDLSGSVRVTLVQPNIDPFRKWELHTGSDMMGIFYRITGRAVFREVPDLVIWPETAIPFFILDTRYSGYFQSLYMAVREWRVALLSGFSDIEYYHPASERAKSGRVKFDSTTGRHFETFNASLMMNADGRKPQVYHKNRLVPFAERVPYVDYFPWLDRFTFSLAGISSWGRGTDTPVMKFNTRRNGTVETANIICYESIFPGLVTGFVRNGAEFLTLVTNDGWYATSYGPYQHVAIAKLRCIENRRAMARCANTGITAFIDRYGRVYDDMPWWKEGTLTADVPLYRDMTLYTRFPDLLPKTSVAVSVLLLVVAFSGIVRR